MSLTAMMKVYPACLWLAASSRCWTGSISHQYSNAIHSAAPWCIYMCVCACVSFPCLAFVCITWPRRRAVSGCALYRLCGHTSSRVSAVNKSGLLLTQPYVCVCVCVRACVHARVYIHVCVGLSQTSQQEWKRQPHDNVTSPPFIPATQHSETKQQQPSNLKKAAWFTADMTSITNTNPPLPAPSRGSASCSHLHLIQAQ